MNDNVRLQSVLLLIAMHGDSSGANATTIQKLYLDSLDLLLATLQSASLRRS